MYCDQAEEWITEMVSKPGFFRHINDIVMLMTKGTSLTRMKFVSNILELKNCQDGDVIIEDDYADMQFNFAWGLIAKRCRRGLHITRGWPNQLYNLVGKDAAAARDTVMQFKKDVELYDDLVKADVPGEVPQVVLKRHVFRLTCNKQMIEGFKEAKWDLSTPAGQTIIKILKQNARLHWSTLPVEETLGYMKNGKERKSRKFRKPEVTMMYGIKGKVLEERCKYLPVKMDRPLKHKTERLPPAAFRPDKNSRSMPFHTIVSKNSNTSWHSPTATDLNDR